MNLFQAECESDQLLDFEMEGDDQRPGLVGGDQRPGLGNEDDDQRPGLEFEEVYQSNV